MSGRTKWILAVATALTVIVLFSLGCPAVNVHLRAVMGDANAMYEIGEAYRHVGGAGIVDPQSDPKEADRWFRMAAQKGHTGAMYSMSQGGDIPNEERVMWLKKGAEMGSETCMVELGNAYLERKFGLAQDFGASLYWSLNASGISYRRMGYKHEEVRQKLELAERARRSLFKYQGPIRPLP